LHRDVAVATIRGRPYYNITSALKLMELQFDSISPEEAAMSKAKVIITTQDEAIIVNRKGAVMFDTELEKYPAIAKAKILRSIAGDRADDQLTIGIDPGSRIGISAIYLHQEIASAVESSPQDAVDQVSAMLGGIESRKKVVKIGDGDIVMARHIARILKKKFQDQISVEIVDEHGTSQNADANKRGARDRSSARTIAFRSGKSFTLK
jgi:RNase H-fold protein (predicted Holliday junction resolvase)